jgi:hypothetical protein
MKKIALLLTILCASQLYGMEKEKPELNPAIWGQAELPNDTKILIIMALAQSGDNINEAIKNIETASRINKASNTMVNINNLQGFTKIVHMVADKFDKSPYYVANLFTIPIAQKYIKLGNALVSYIKDHNVKTDDIVQLINQGADVNYYDDFGSAPLATTIMNSDLKMVQLLLNSGANPEERHLWLAEALYNKSYPETITIKELIEDAMKKQTTIAK